eukprot:jgi/Psemu1/1682/gm1.1682_g
MQCGANGIWDETGCFVYEVIAPHRIHVRTSPNNNSSNSNSNSNNNSNSNSNSNNNGTSFCRIQNLYFEPGELVSVDLIRHARADHPRSRPPVESSRVVSTPRHQQQQQQQQQRSDSDSDNDNGNGNGNGNGNDGPFLRLSDGSGWILAREAGRDLVVRRLVETRPNESEKSTTRTTTATTRTNGNGSGPELLWTFYADNLPDGIELRRHPNEELRNPHDSNRFAPGEGGVTYRPMQKIVCDRKVSAAAGAGAGAGAATGGSHSNSNFYRVQGTCGWVLDRRGRSSGGNNNYCYHGAYRELMVPDRLVETGLFAFRVTATDGMVVRRFCHVGDGPDNTTPTRVECGETIVADVVRHSPLPHGNGPFVRLRDGSGWLFRHGHGMPGSFLEPVPVARGRFRLRIRSEEGIRPRGQPIASDRFHDSVGPTDGAGGGPRPLLKRGETVVCDRKLLSGNSVAIATTATATTTTGCVCWYRQSGTELWIADKRIDETTGSHEVLAEAIVPTESESESPGSSSLLGKTTRSAYERNSTSNPDPDPDTNHHSLKSSCWSPHFVRGNANAICYLEEIGFDARTNVLSYRRSGDGVTIHVYCDTRTIGTVTDVHSSRHQVRAQRFVRNCSDAELIEILREPRAYVCRRHDARPGRCSKRARSGPLSPSHTRCLASDDDRCGYGGRASSDISSQPSSSADTTSFITPDESTTTSSSSSSSSNIGIGSESIDNGDDCDCDDDCDDDDDDDDCDWGAFDAELESRKNLVECQEEIRNLLYRQGNLVRAIQLHEEERMREAEITSRKSERIALHQRRQREQREQQLQLQQQQQQQQAEEEEEYLRARRRRTGRQLVRENIFVGSIVGCFLGLALSPYCGSFLVQKLGLQHLQSML